MDDDLVRFLERRANALRLRYTASTAPQALLDLVSDKEHREVRERGSEGMPGCFGDLFAGPYDPDCDSCQVQTACMARLAWVKMPEIVANIGSDDSTKVASAMDLDPKAIVLTQTFAAQASGRDSSLFTGYRLLKPLERPKVMQPYELPRPFGLATYACVLGSRAKLKVWGRDVTTMTYPGGSKILGLSRVAYFKPPKKSPAWTDRYMRERKRNILYAQLRTGMVLRKVHKGILHEVRCGWRCYEYEGQIFPTLYACVQAVAGSIQSPREHDEQDRRKPGVKNTTMSPTKFFHQAFRQLVHRLPPKRKRKKAKKASPASSHA